MDKIKIGDTEVEVSTLKAAIGDSFVFRSRSEDEEVLNRFKDTKIQEYSKNIFETFEGTIKELVGIEKQNNEKAIDYLKRAFSEKITSFKSIEEENKKLKDESQTAQLYKQKIEEMQQTYSSQIESIKNEKEKLEKGIFRSKLEAQTSSIFGELRAQYNPDTPKEVIALVEQSIIDKVLGMDIRDNFIIFENGLPKTDESFRQVDLKKYISDSIKPLIGAKKAAGSGAGGENKGSFDSAKGVINFEGIKTKSDLLTLIQKAGIRQFTDDFDKAWAEGIKYLGR